MHSPSVGPATWDSVAQRLRELGHEVVVPSLLTVGVGPPPYWPRVAAAVADALPGTLGERSVTLVGHSNAGCYMPVIADRLGDRVAGCVFVDAALPPLSGATPVAPPELLSFLESIAVEGVLPQWTEWWDEADVAPMFPNAEVRRVVSAEQPRLPIEYYRQEIPVPETWPGMRGAYLAFGDAYDAEVAQAETWGWPTARMAGAHLHQLVDPDGVAQRIAELADAVGS